MYSYHGYSTRQYQGAAAESSNSDDAENNDNAMSPIVISSSLLPQRVSQEERRRKRRRLHRILNNPEKVLPSFLRAIEAEPPFVNLVDSDDEGDINHKNAVKDEDVLPEVDENDFLIDPPTEVIDVDEYLGLKRKAKKEDDEDSILC